MEIREKDNQRRKYSHIYQCLGSMIAMVLLDFSHYYFAGLIAISILVEPMLASAYGELETEFYLHSAEELVELKYYPPIYLKLYGYKMIPKRLKRLTDIYLIFYVLYTVISGWLWIIGAKKEYTIYLMGVFILLVVMLSVGYGCKNIKLRFYYRFRCVNRYNIKHFILAFLWPPSTRKWPLSRNLGRCTVVAVEEQTRNRYAVVKMQKTKEVQKRVLIPKEIDIREDAVYKLYEICRVKYIM